MLRINPQTEIEEIVQNVKTILSTPKGSVPLLRDFGISVDLIDTLTPELQMRVKEEVFLQVEGWEKRAKVKKVSVLVSDDGKAKITVTLQTRYGVVNVSSG
jgi:phage baseplate assembly protein W